MSREKMEPWLSSFSELHTSSMTAGPRPKGCHWAWRWQTLVQVPHLQTQSLRTSPLQVMSLGPR